jgi:hypothetical protein
MMKKILSMTAGALLLALGATPTLAATAQCPPAPAVGARVFSITAPDATSPACHSFGEGNESIADFPGSTFLAKVEGNDGTSGALTVTGIEALSGTWSINATLLSAYSSFLLVFKSGEGTLNPDWAAFSLANIGGIISGTWAILTGTQSLSHVSLYGIIGPALVPLPGALLLFGSVLAGGAGFAGWRRRRQRVVA